jgi:hypothetical protein
MSAHQDLPGIQLNPIQAGVDVQNQRREKREQALSKSQENDRSTLHDMFKGTLGEEADEAVRLGTVPVSVAAKTKAHVMLT